MKAFLLAGGFATRLWPLTERRPKPLLPLLGKPMLTHLVEKIPKDIPVTVSTNASFEGAFRTWMERIDHPKLNLVVEGTTKDDHKLGALGAVAQWITDAKIDDDLLILTGDNYLGFDLQAFLQAFTGKPLLAAHDIGDPEKARQFGVVVAEGTRVTGFEEKPREPKSTLVSTGCVILPKAALPVLLAFAKVKPDNLGGIFEELLQKKFAVDCFSFSEPWVDIGSFGSYLDAHRKLTGEHVIADPSAFLTGTTCKGSISIGGNAKIINSELTDCMIFDDVVIENCTLRNCVIDDACVLKGIDLSGQMLRSGTTLVLD